MNDKNIDLQKELQKYKILGAICQANAVNSKEAGEMLEYYKEKIEEIKSQIEKLKPKEEPKRFPRPEYCKCNKGHELVEVYDELRNAYFWDCPTCIDNMIRRGKVESHINEMMYGDKPLQDIKW